MTEYKSQGHSIINVMAANRLAQSGFLKPPPELVEFETCYRRSFVIKACFQLMLEDPKLRAAINAKVDKLISTDPCRPKHRCKTCYGSKIEYWHKTKLDSEIPFPKCERCGKAETCIPTD